MNNPNSSIVPILSDIYLRIMSPDRTFAKKQNLASLRGIFEFNYFFDFHELHEITGFSGFHVFMDLFRISVSIY